MELGLSMGNNARNYLPELPNTMFKVLICWVSNGNTFILSPKQFPASYIDLEHWEELVDFIEKNVGVKLPDILTLMIRCTLEQDELDKEYVGLYSHGEVMNNPIYGQTSYSCCRTNAFKLKLGHDVNKTLGEMMSNTWKEITTHEFSLAMIFPASCVKASHVLLLMQNHRHSNILKHVEQSKENMIVGRE